MRFWKKIQAIRTRFKKLESQRASVEFDENGFVLKWDRWPLKPLCQCIVCWKDVAKIDISMRDCFAAHIVSLVFYDEEDRYMKHVHEDVKGYDDFTKYVKERFSGFNSHNFQAIEMMFPSDISFPCWDRNKKIDDLEVKREDNKILWKDSREVFLEWKE